MSLFYQVECSVTSAGKRVAATKRQVRWRWGTPNQNALADGATGVQCRGQEHEVTLVWSITSGKRRIFLDGKEVHCSNGRRSESKFQYSWTASEVGNDVLTINAFAAVPLRPKPGFKQFDLLVNGQSCRNMIHIYELGMHENSKKLRELVVPKNLRHRAITDPPIKEDRWKWMPVPLSRTKSLPSKVPQKEASPALQRSKSVIFPPDFLSDPSPIMNNGDLLSAPFPVEVNHYHTPNDDKFNPNKPPTREAIWSNIMNAYGSGNTNQAVTQPVETKVWRTTETTGSNANPARVYPAPIRQVQTGNTLHEYGSIRGQTDGMHNKSGIAYVQTKNTNYDSGNLQVQSNNFHDKTGVKSPRHISGIDGAMQNLVNLEDIRSPAVNTASKMNSNTVNRSINGRAFPPKIGLQGQISHSTLQELKQMQGNKMGSQGQISHSTLQELKQMQGNKDINPTKEVMKSYTHYATGQNSAGLAIQLFS